jgi:hypothetical protein
MDGTSSILGMAQGVTTRNLKPLPRGKPSGIPFLAHFTDVAAQAGLTIPVVYGGLKHKNYIIETVGCGVAFLDYDNDGWLDIFVLSGTRMDCPFQIPVIASTKITGMALTDVTEKARLIRSGWASGVTVGDYNNDGFEDIFVTYYGQNVLYRHNGMGHLVMSLGRQGCSMKAILAGDQDAPFWTMIATATSISSLQTMSTCIWTGCQTWCQPVLQFQRCGSQLWPSRPADAAQLPISKSGRRDVSRCLSGVRHRKGTAHLLDDQCGGGFQQRRLDRSLCGVRFDPKPSISK